MRKSIKHNISFSSIMGSDTVDCCSLTAKTRRNGLSPSLLLKDLGSRWRVRYYGKVVIRVWTRIARNAANHNRGKGSGDGARTVLNKISSSQMSESNHKTTKCHNINTQNTAIWTNPTAKLQSVTKCHNINTQNTAIWTNPTAKLWNFLNVSVINNRRIYFNYFLQ